MTNIRIHSLTAKQKKLAYRLRECMFTNEMTERDFNLMKGKYNFLFTNIVFKKKQNTPKK